MMEVTASGVCITEWATKKRGSGLRGSLADAHLTVKYFGFMCRLNAETGGVIKVANFQSASTKGPFASGVYNRDRTTGEYTLDAAGLVLSLIFAWINAKDAEVAVLDADLMIPDGTAPEAVHVTALRRGNSTLVLFCNFTAATFSLAKGRFQAREVQLHGQHPSDYHGLPSELPLTDGVTMRSPAVLTESTTTGDLLPTIKPFGVGIFEFTEMSLAS